MVDILDLKMKECYEKNNKNGNFSSKENFCELIFDGIMCWTATKAGSIAIQQCPSYLVSSDEHATKECMEDGEWFIHEETKVKWTNYSQCWKTIDEETALVDIDIAVENSTLYHIWFPILKNVTHWGYGISLFTLVASLTIFIGIKRLQCARNRLHMHLFFSFIMRILMSLIKDFVFVEGIAMESDVVIVNGLVQYIKEHNSWTCKAIISARNYFIVANYMLILMEGIYLHNLMFLTPFSDNSRITIYYILGWGLPLCFIIPWVLVRIHYEDTLCWTTSANNYYSMLINIPVTLSVFISFVLFLMIVRILLVKLNSMYIQQRKLKYRKLTRSTLVLVPLFGVPYTISLIMSYTTTENKTWELIWLFADQVFTSFQGFFVASIYCLFNGEVLIEVKHKYSSIMDRHEHRKRLRERTISHTQQFPSTVIQLQDFP